MKVTEHYDRADGPLISFEIIPPRHLPRSPDTVLRALKRLYNLGVQPEWWKLEPMPAAAWSALDALIAERDPHCRGVLLLGLAATQEALVKGFAEARAARSCRGFAVGRTIFEAPARAWLAGAIDDAALVARTAGAYHALIAAWQAARGNVREARAA